MRQYVWRFIDWLSDFMCRRGWHEWEGWRANTYRQRVLSDWHRSCTRCGQPETACGKISPGGQVHPGPTVEEIFKRMAAKRQT